MDSVKRGYVYEFDDGKKDTKRYVLVVSADHRSSDKFVSTLMFGTSGIGHDVVSVKNDYFPEKELYLHCGMITYTNHEYLLRECFQLPEAKMRKVDRFIAREFAINEDAVAKAEFYEKAYNELLTRVMNKEDGYGY